MHASTYMWVYMHVSSTCGLTCIHMLGPQDVQLLAQDYVHTQLPLGHDMVCPFGMCRSLLAVVPPYQHGNSLGNGLYHLAGGYT